MSLRSLSATYGGLLTTTSHRRTSSGGSRALQRRNSTRAPSREALPAATLSAASEMSHASTRLPPHSKASDTAIHPEPVPTSSARQPAAILPAASSTSRAVSGRGMSTDGLTWKTRPRKSAWPRTYCTGSPCWRRLKILSSNIFCSADNSLTLPLTKSVSESPNRKSSTVRATACASPAE